MLGIIFAIIAGFVRNHFFAFGVWLLTFGTYAAVDITSAAKPANTPALVGLGFIAASAAVWCVLGYAIGVGVRWIAARLQKGHWIHY